MVDETGDMIKITKEANVLQCPMTEQEIQAEQGVLLRTLQSMDDLATEKDAAIADFKFRDKKLKEKFNECRVRLATRNIMRGIECSLLLNWTQLTATLTRLDTGEVVQQRAMNDDERKMPNTPELPFDDKNYDPTIQEDTSAETVIEGEQEDDQSPDPTDAGSSPGTDDQSPDPTMTKDEVNAHAEEKFGPDPCPAPDAKDQNGAQADSATTVDTSLDDAQADADLEQWMGMDN